MPPVPIEKTAFDTTNLNLKVNKDIPVDGRSTKELFSRHGSTKVMERKDEKSIESNG